VTVPESATGRVFHHQKRCTIFNSKIKHPHDVRVSQACQCASFFRKLFDIFFVQYDLQDFQRGIVVEIDMLPKVDFGETTSS
jgi:hypothetical protein